MRLTYGTEVGLRSIETAANSAKTAANNVQKYLDGTNNGGKSLVAIYDLVNLLNASLGDSISNTFKLISPTINKVTSKNGATCTLSNQIEVNIYAGNANQYRARDSQGSWTEWSPSNIVNTPLTGSEARIIEVQAKYKNDDYESQPTTSSIIIFKL